GSDARARSIASAEAQTYRHVEVVLAEPSVDLMAASLPEGDPELLFVAISQLTEAAALTAEAAAARGGSWILPLPAGVELEPDAVETLVEVALQHELEFVYGEGAVVLGDGRNVAIGSWPPSPEGLLL